MAITFGPSGAPSQETRNFDSLFTTSLSNYQKTMADNISTSNAVFARIRASKAWEGVDGGTDIKIPLMYALGTADWYEGYDTLDTTPMNGHTMSIWEWREMSIPVVVSQREEVQNRQNIMGLVKAKIQQAEMGIKESLAKAFFQGAAATAGTGIETPQTSSRTGASGIHTLAQLVQKDPTSSETVGNINQSTSTWWRNQTKSSSASNYEGILSDLQNVFNSCGKGPGGSPDLIITDQAGYELVERVLYNRGGSRHQSGPTLEFPFEHIKWRGATIVWDEFIPDVQNDSTTITKSSFYFLNTKYFHVKYVTGLDFKATPFKSAPNQPNARVSHIMWMGNVCISNRRKHGVLYNVTNTLTS